ncbi:MAG: MBL fold metallo-hydrolase, partial [Acidimicrobiales bacterium]
PGRGAEAVAPLLRRVLAPNPGLMTGPGTNTYIVGAAEVAVVDPGPDDPGHLQTVASAAGPALRWILVTHAHPDHAPGAAALSELTGAVVLGYDERAGFRPDRRLSDGDHAAGGPGWALVALHTPGHSSDHLCYLLDSRDGARVLLSGDHVMDGSTVVVAPPDGDMAAYLQGLRRLMALAPPPDAIAPGHGGMIGDPGARLAEYLSHRLEREAALAGALAGLPEAGVDDLVRLVYADVPGELWPVARYSVWAHLRKLAGEGKAVTEDVDRLDSRWRAV